MRILVVSNLYPPEFLGGYELGCAQMVDELYRRGHDVRVVTSVSAAKATVQGVVVHRVLQLPPIYSPDRMQTSAALLNRYFHVLSAGVNPDNVAAVSQVLSEFDPEVCYLWNILGLGALGLLSLLDHQGVSWVWHIMDLIPRQITGFATSGTRLATQLNRTFPGRYIGCSSHVLNEIAAGSVDLGHEVYVVPNWVHGDPPFARQRYFRDFPGKLRILSACGALGEPKGTPILIEMAGQLRDRGVEDFHVDLYGHIKDQRFRLQILERGVSDFVTLRGARRHDELLGLYSGYDVFAFPTWSREPFGFAPLEAAAYGCVPLVTGDCGYAEWMIDGVDCLKASRSAEAFADRIVQILDGEPDLRSVGTRAQAVVWRDFHISSAAAKVEAVLSDAARSRSPARAPVSKFLDLARFAEGLIQALIEESQASS